VWIKLYRKLLDDRQFGLLDGESVKLLIHLWLIAAETDSTDGTLPSHADIAWRLRTDEKSIVTGISQLSHWIEIDDSMMIYDCSEVARPEKNREEKRERREEAEYTRTRINDFDAFWRAYPKRVGKQAAKRAWRKVLSKLPQIDDLVAITEQQTQWSQWKEGYIPNPSTWLNAGRWEDEPPPETQSKAAAMRQRSLEALRQDVK